MQALFENSVTDIHCFERAGLGKAPFHYRGTIDQNVVHGLATLGNGLQTKPGGTCDYCGTAILNMFSVESSDGRRFKVGCECIKKTGDTGMIRLLDADIAKRDRAKRDARKHAKQSADKAYCESKQLGKLADRPHPAPWFASEGKTLADWARWMMEQNRYRSLAQFLRAEFSEA
jgi:hypothetical protein